MKAFAFASRFVLAVALSAATLAQAEDPFILDQNGCKIINPVSRPDETVTWSGPCKDGFAEGTGVVQFYLSGIADEKYEGEVKGGYADGTGTLMMLDGGRYEGQWSRSKQEGEGSYFAPDGSIYKGAWKNGKPHGFGTYRTPEGQVTRGQWQDGRFVKETEEDPNRT